MLASQAVCPIMSHMSWSGLFLAAAMTVASPEKEATFVAAASPPVLTAASAHTGLAEGQGASSVSKDTGSLHSYREGMNCVDHQSARDEATCPQWAKGLLLFVRMAQNTDREGQPLRSARGSCRMLDSLPYKRSYIGIAAVSTLFCQGAAKTGAATGPSGTPEIRGRGVTCCLPGSLIGSRIGRNHEQKESCPPDIMVWMHQVEDHTKAASPAVSFCSDLIAVGFSYMLSLRGPSSGEWMEVKALFSSEVTPVGPCPDRALCGGSAYSVLCMSACPAAGAAIKRVARYSCSMAAAIGAEQMIMAGVDGSQGSRLLRSAPGILWNLPEQQICLKEILV